MSDVIHIIVKGNPVALKRHRTTIRGGKPHNYDPSAIMKQNFLMTVQHKAPTFPLITPICIKAMFFMPRPKSHYRTGKFSGILKDNAPLYHKSTPDLDNLIKFFTDSLNGIFYKDDSQICSIRATKLYSDEPRTEIQIWEK